MDKLQRNKKILELHRKKLKWSENGTGPDSFDCQGWILFIKKEFYNEELPCVKVNVKSLFSVVKAISKDKVWDQFEKLDHPEDGCIVKIFTAEDPNHIGIYMDIDGGGVSHCDRKNGVIWDDLFTIKQMYNQITFWKFTGGQNG